MVFARTKMRKYLLFRHFRTYDQMVDDFIQKLSLSLI